MLKYYEVENFRSFKQKTRFSLEKTNYKVAWDLTHEYKIACHLIINYSRPSIIFSNFMLLDAFKNIFSDNETPDFI